MSDIYRMPVGFGPSLGPRQGPEGRRFSGEVSRHTTLAVTFATDADQLAAVLPPGYEPAPDPVVKVTALYNPSLAWLAGRGYDFIEVTFSVVFRGESTVDGDLVAVMWETLADPIIVGREEVGHPKLYADITQPQSTATGTRVRASWFGFDFLDLEFDGLEIGAWPTELEAEAQPELSLPPFSRTTGSAGDSPDRDAARWKCGYRDPRILER
jgi:hypothetical protein